MRKVLKSSLVVLVLLLLLVTCTGCKKEEKINESNNTEVIVENVLAQKIVDETVSENIVQNEIENIVEGIVENVVGTEEVKEEITSTMEKRTISSFDDTKTGKFYNKFSNGNLTTKYEMNVNEQHLTMISSVGEKKSYIETILDGERISSVLTIDGVYYTVDHSSKTIIEMTTGYQASGGIGSYVVTDRDVDLNSFAEGKITIEDVTYDAEEWNIENEKVKMCFENDELKYIVSGTGESEYVIKILEISNEVNEDLFKLPSDYTKMKF